MTNYPEVPCIYSDYYMQQFEKLIQQHQEYQDRRKRKGSSGLSTKRVNELQKQHEQVSSCVNQVPYVT